MKTRIQRFTFTLVVGIALAIGLSGCQSVPEGSASMKQRALSFNPPAGEAGVYVIRLSRMTGAAVLIPVSLDFQEFGSLENGSYLYGTVPPGTHMIRIPEVGGGKGTPFASEAGKNYFFTIKPGWIAPQIDPVPEADGQAYVQKYKLSGDNRFEYQERTSQRP